MPQPAVEMSSCLMRLFHQPSWKTKSPTSAHDGSRLYIDARFRVWCHFFSVSFSLKLTNHFRNENINWFLHYCFGMDLIYFHRSPSDTSYWFTTCACELRKQLPQEECRPKGEGHISQWRAVATLILSSTKYSNWVIVADNDMQGENASVKCLTNVKRLDNVF